MNIGKWVKTQKQFFILGKEIRPKPSDYHAIQGTIIHEQMKLWFENNREFIESIADMRGDE